MEYIDVLDEFGNKQGIVKNKRKIYKDSNWHRSVHIWIINSQKEILMQKRNPHKETFPNMWAISVAGHVQTGETPIEACQRELKEELGIDVKEEELTHLFKLNRIQSFPAFTIKVIDEVYLLKKDLDVNRLTIQKDELVKVKYFSYQDFKTSLVNHDSTFVPMSEEHEKLFPILDQIMR